MWVTRHPETCASNGESTRTIHMTATPSARALNSTIKAEMARRDINQTRLAAIVGVTQTQVSARLRGTIEWRVSELQTIAAAFDMPVADLIPDGETAVAS